MTPQPRSGQSNRNPNAEYHDGDETPLCVACNWCCGCAVHPIGKPWGWNHEAWERHYESHHQVSGEPVNYKPEDFG